MLTTSSRLIYTGGCAVPSPFIRSPVTAPSPRPDLAQRKDTTDRRRHTPPARPPRLLPPPSEKTHRKSCDATQSAGDNSHFQCPTPSPPSDPPRRAQPRSTLPAAPLPPRRSADYGEIHPAVHWFLPSPDCGQLLLAPADAALRAHPWPRGRNGRNTCCALSGHQALTTLHGY